MADIPASSAAAVLDTWRESGADRIDPVRFRTMAAMARRAEGYTGAARRVLDDRLAALIATYGDAVRAAAGAARPADREPAGRSSGARESGDLAALVADLRPDARADDTADVAHLSEYFRDTWVRVRARRELRHSAERVPENAGPLNSNHLIQRSLSLMGEVSPGYLQQFLTYVDGLASLEALVAPASVPAREAAQTAGRKGPRGKPRKDAARPSS